MIREPFSELLRGQRSTGVLRFNVAADYPKSLRVRGTNVSLKGTQNIGIISEDRCAV